MKFLLKLFTPGSFLLTYWRAILAASIVGSGVGYLWYLNAEIDSQRVENSLLTVAISGYESTLTALQEDKVKVDAILLKYQREEKERKAQQDVLNKELKELMEKSNEKCYSTNLGGGVDQWLQQNSH